LIFDDILLVTDVDGTLLTDDKRITEKNDAAIREFRENGGIFTIATGRGVTSARSVAEALELSTPAVLYNGAAIYDYMEGCFLWQSSLPAISREYIFQLMGRFPTLGVEILCGESVYVIRMNELEKEHLSFGRITPIRCCIDEVPPVNWIKALFVDEERIINEAVGYISAHGHPGVHLVRSGTIYYEMLPQGINKGSGVEMLRELIGARGRRVVAVGDFDNDIEMIRFADIGVAVAGALNQVIEAADLVVCDNNRHAIREVVDYIKAMRRQ